MESLPIGEMIKQLPNFLGLILCLFVLRDTLKQAREDHQATLAKYSELVRSMIARENCEDKE
jgi:hypothetical protein